MMRRALGCSLRAAVFMGATVLIVGSVSLGIETRALAAPKKKVGKKPRAVKGAIEVHGRLRVVRGEDGKEVRLRVFKGRRWTLLGRYRGELLRLNNHRVRVWASLAKKTLHALRVVRYELMASKGRTPLIGTLRLATPGSGALALARGKKKVPITGGAAFIERLRRRVGCRIWIVGDRVEGRLRAFKFGWLSCGKRWRTKPIGSNRKEMHR